MRIIFFFLTISFFHVRFSLFLVLDKVVCPFLLKYFDMQIWHPTCEITLDQLLKAKVDMYILPFSWPLGLCLIPFMFLFQILCNGSVVKKMFMFNKHIVHLIDDIFWNMGFKTEAQTEKVIDIIRILRIIHIILFVTIILIIHIIFRFVSTLELHHVWQDKRSAIVQTVDAVGDKFQAAVDAGWLSYIRKTYPDGAVSEGPSLGESSALIVAD